MNKTPNSNMVINTIIRMGNKDNKSIFSNISLHEKSDNIASNMCPAVKLAASLIPKAIGLEM